MTIKQVKNHLLYSVFTAELFCATFFKLPEIYEIFERKWMNSEIYEIFARKWMVSNGMILVHVYWISPPCLFWMSGIRCSVISVRNILCRVLGLLYAPGAGCSKVG